METSNNQIPPKNYTYDNWWNGDVTLVDATRYFEKGDEPVIVNWEDFSESDVNRIKEKQMELFKAKVNALLNPVIKQFNKRYEASKMKSTYLRDERKQCWYVMFGELPNYEIVQLDQWRISHTNQYLSDVQDYVERTIKNGIDDGLGFIHSPNCKYQDISKPDSRIYAKFVSMYFNWLNKFKKEEESKKRILRAKEEIESLEKDPLKLIDKNIAIQNRIWFKVGLSFANGEMDTLIIKHTIGTMTNCTAIARELGNTNFRPYISESMGGTKINDKNIFSNKEKIEIIENYCESNTITVVESFYKRKK
jgi:hypothetical protein